MTQDCSYNELYPLQVLDDSMAPEFPKDCIIVIEPASVCTSGAYVIASALGDRWFRQFVRDEDGNEKLVALNDLYQPILLDGASYQIEGVIVQCNINNNGKREVKHYNPYKQDNSVEIR